LTGGVWCSSLENELAGDGRMVEALQAFKAGTFWVIDPERGRP
jgi:hypothetical protein